jgi:hypothetical protein
MDSELERYEADRKERLRELAQNALLRDEDPVKAKILRFRLAARKPGLKQLMGENPLADEEFNELEKYFRLTRGSR